jgi:hypothetical protein
MPHKRKAGRPSVIGSGHWAPTSPCHGRALERPGLVCGVQLIDIEDPVEDQVGYVYERAAIESYLRSKGNKGKCPQAGTYTFVLCGLAWLPPCHQFCVSAAGSCALICAAARHAGTTHEVTLRGLKRSNKTVIWQKRQRKLIDAGTQAESDDDIILDVDDV